MNKKIYERLVIQMIDLSNEDVLSGSGDNDIAYDNLWQGALGGGE